MSSSSSNAARPLTPTSPSSTKSGGKTPKNKLHSHQSSDSSCFPGSGGAGSGNGASSKGSRVPSGMSTVLQTEISFTQDQLQSTEYVRFGDSIKVFATSWYLKNEVKEKTNLVGSQLGGYIGIYEKPDGTARLAIPPIGKNADGVFKESVLRIQDPRAEKIEGQEVRYGDMLILVDENGLVWNNKCGAGTFAGFFEGYLGPKPRGTNGELYLSFQKNGHDRRPVIYGENAVYIDVEASHRYRSSYNYRLTNYRSSNSRVVGGYVCSDGTGYEIPFMIHRHTGPPVQAYKNEALERRLSIIAKRRSSYSVRSSSPDGSVFVPPKIKHVGVLRQTNNGEVLDIMMKEPLYGKPIKLYDVYPEDTIIIELDQENTPAKIDADHIFSAAENAAATSMSTTGPLQLDIAVEKSKNATTPKKKEEEKSSGENRTTLELTSVELLVEQDIEVLRRAFRDDDNLLDPMGNKDDEEEYGNSDGQLGKLDLLIASHKLAMVYFGCAVVGPYFIWQAILVVGELIEPIHQLSERNRSLQVIERLATTLVQDFGIEVVNGKALIDDDIRTMETTTFFSSFLAFFVAYIFGLITPRFATRGTFAKTKQTVSDDEESANWLISIQIPEGSWETPKLVHISAAGSSRTEWGDDDDNILEEEEEEDGDAGIKVNGIPLRGSWGEAGVDENGVPKHPAFKRFLAGEKGDVEKAKARWIQTCEWRVDGNIDKLLEEPHPLYHVIKKNLPNFYHGRGKSGHPVYIDCPGGVKMKNLRKAGVRLADLLFHYTYCTEFQWEMLEPSEEGRTISILDLEGIGLWDFAGEVIDFVKKTIALSGAHYPERAYKIYILRAPRFFTGIWGVIKPWLDEETKKKIGLFRSGYEKALLEEIDADVLPEKYGGTNTTPLGQSKEERMLESHVCKVLLEKNVPMRDDAGNDIPGSPQNLEPLVDEELLKTSGQSMLNWDLINSRK